MPAPKGNQNAAKGRKWRAAIERALEARSRKAQKDALDDLAEKLLLACDGGELSALKELGDRLDGKAHQSMDVGISDNRTAGELSNDELASIAAGGREGASKAKRSRQQSSEVH